MNTVTPLNPSSPLPAALTRLQPWRSGVALALDWALIGASLAAAMRWPQPLVWGVAAVLIARSQLALAVLMHEAAHGLLAQRRGLNDALGQWLAAGPLWLSLPAYRSGHLQHHRSPMTADDPVARVFGIADYPVSRAELALRLARDLCGLGYLLTLRDLWRDRHRPRPPAPRTSAGQTVSVVASIVVGNGLLAGGLWALGHGGLYLGLWLLPSLTLLQLFARIRAITEHAGYPASTDQRMNARSVVRPSWQTFFCGPHGIHFHIEHHTHVRVPCYHLAAVHQHMRDRNELPPGNLFAGYGDVMRQVVVR